MEPLHKGGSTDKNPFVPKEGQRPLLCSNRVGSRCPSLDSDHALSNETLYALEELGDVLRDIYQRMTAEGYELVGRICKTQSQHVYEENTTQNRKGSD